MESSLNSIARVCWKLKKLSKILVVVEEKIIVVQQFRKLVNKTTIELPGGKIESNETALEAAIRELREETGIVSEEFLHLGSYINSESTIEVNLFFTNQVTRIGKSYLDLDEDIEVQYHSVPLVLENILSGKWNDIRLGMACLIARSKGLI